MQMNETEIEYDDSAMSLTVRTGETSLTFFSDAPCVHCNVGPKSIAEKTTVGEFVKNHCIPTEERKP